MRDESLFEVSPPASLPIRAYDDPDVFACQSDLMAMLREADAA